MMVVLVSISVLQEVEQGAGPCGVFPGLAATTAASVRRTEVNFMVMVYV
jgi:hypothetical protein